MTEDEVRRAIVSEARSWIGTPYVSNAMIKGRRGGVDCAMLPIAVYSACGLIPKEFDPRPYPPQWHVHRNEEKYLAYVQQFTHEIATPAPGDFAMFKVGFVFAHGAIVTQWPMVIHAVGNAIVFEDDISKQTVGKRALARVQQRFFSLWSRSA